MSCLPRQPNSFEVYRLNRLLPVKKRVTSSGKQGYVYIISTSFPNNYQMLTKSKVDIFHR